MDLNSAVLDPAAAPTLSAVLESDAPLASSAVLDPAVPLALSVVPTRRWQPASGYEARQDRVAEETPVALEYNGQPHVVMLASPTDLEDFALGFSLTEGLIDSPADLLQWQCESYPGGGIRLQLQITPTCAARLASRSKNLTGRTGCGLCGAEQLAQVFRPLPPLAHTQRLSLQALQQALQQVSAYQPLQRQTGATHAAFWLDATGQMVLGREDVGRHNALDKLLGARARACALTSVAASAATRPEVHAGFAHAQARASAHTGVSAGASTGASAKTSASIHTGANAGASTGASISPSKSASSLGAVLITSRASMEMVQKSVQQGVEILVAISAPTALAIDLAQRHGQTLVGFARPGQMTLYTHPQRLFDAAPSWGPIPS